jgi:hypothetical protein
VAWHAVHSVTGTRESLEIVRRVFVVHPSLQHCSSLRKSPNCDHASDLELLLPPNDNDAERYSIFVHATFTRIHATAPPLAPLSAISERLPIGTASSRYDP